MLFERTCRIEQDFDWFLRFVPQNSVEKRKNSKNHPESCIQKQAARFLSPACLGMFEPSKMFFMFLFVIPVNQNANAAQLRLKSEKSTRIIQKAAYKNRQHDFFRLPVLGMFEPSKTFFHVSVCDTSESSANAAQFRLRCQNRQESIRKLHKNRQHDSFACLFWGCLSHQRRFSCFCL